MKPRFNEPLYNEVIAVTNDILQPDLSLKCLKQILDILVANPRYYVPIFPVPERFVKARFHCYVDN